MKFWLYVLTIFFGFTLPTFAQSNLLTYGDPVSADVNAENTRFRYSFEGTAGDTIYASVYVPNPNMDITANLFGPNGTQLGSATDNAIGTILGPYELTSTGSYTLEVFQPDYNVGETATIEITVDTANVTAIKPDGRYSGTLAAEGDIAFFSYTGPVNELFGYQSTGQNIGFFMYTPNGTPFIQNFGGDGLFEPLQVLPESGKYTAFLQTSNPGGTDYTLSLTPINIVDLEAGDSYSGKAITNSTQVFKFTSPIDELWRIDVNAPDAQYSSRLDVRSVNDPFTNLVSDSSGGVNGAPRIDPFVSPQNGDYYILLSAGVDFDYTITLEPSTVVRLESGTGQQGTITPETGTQTYIYFGIAGEKVRVNLNTPDGQPGLIVYSPTDELISFAARSAGSSTFEITLPDTGLYRFSLRSIRDDAVELNYSLMLEDAG